MSKPDIQTLISAAVTAALAGQGAAVIPPVTGKAPTESKEAREARKLAVAKALPDALEVAGVKAPLTFTSSRKGKEFTTHAVVNGVKCRVNGYVMPE